MAECPLVVTVEEGVLMGGFGSAVLEAASTPAWTPAASAGSAFPISSSNTAAASELLADLGLDAAGIVRACRQWIGDLHKAASRRSRHAYEMRPPVAA